MTSVPKKPIQTFVFFDLEATDLTRPRITELCLLSVQREEFLARDGSPRVVNKLTLCVDPQKAISPIASNITGLYNDSLESQTSFDKKVVDIMALFLSRLPQPVCLVAHYGNGFDFPLLNAELKRAKCELPLEVVCVDSLDAIRTIDTQTLYEEERARIDIQNQNNSTPTRQGIQSDQAVRPNNPTTSYTATVTQDTMLAKRKADADRIDHVRKRLFTDADKLKVAKEVEIKTRPEMAVVATSQRVQNIEEIKPDTSVVPVFSQDPPQQPKARDEATNVGESIATSLILDSQQSITDDMLMEAVDFVEANDMTGASVTNRPTSGVTVQPSTCTQSTSPSQAHVMCVANGSSTGTGKGDAGLPGTQVPVSGNNGACGTGKCDAGSTGTQVPVSGNSGVCGTGKCDAGLSRTQVPVSGNSGVCGTGKGDAGLPGTQVPVSGNNGVCDVMSIDIVHNNSSCEPPAGDTGRSNTSTGPLHTSVKSSVNNNNVTPVNSSVNNNVTPVKSSANNNNVTPVKSSVNNNNVMPGTSRIQGSDIAISNQGQTTIILPKLSYKLEQIYCRTFGKKPPVSHNAEDDCVTLMKVCKKRCPQFMEWADQHQVSLSSLSPMY